MGDPKAHRPAHQPPPYPGSKRQSLERQQGDKILPTTLYRFTGAMPDLNRIYPPDLALSTDRQWLTENPEAVARVRLVPDDTRTVKQMILLACRVFDPTAPDGWRVAYHEGHYGHKDGIPFDMWRNYPNVSNANRLALYVLAGDADADAGSALTILGGLVVRDLSKCDRYWCEQFTPLDPDTIVPRHKASDTVEANHG